MPLGTGLVGPIEVPTTSNNNPPATNNVFWTRVLSIITVIATLLSAAYYVFKLNTPSKDSFIGSIKVDAKSSTGTSYKFNEDNPARVEFKAHGAWVAIPRDYDKEKNLPKGLVSADGYLDERGSPKYSRHCPESFLGSLAVITENGSCIATGSQGTLDLKRGDTVYFVMSDSIYGDNTGEMTVELFKVKK